MPEWMTPLLWPLWWRAISGSFSSTARRNWGKRLVASMAVDRPTIPPPITRTSKLCCGICSKRRLSQQAREERNRVLLHDQGQVRGMADRARGGGYGEGVGADRRGGVGRRHNRRRAAAIATTAGAKQCQSKPCPQHKAEQDLPAMSVTRGEDESGKHGQEYRWPPEGDAAPRGDGSYYGAGKDFQRHRRGGRARGHHGRREGV